MGGKKCLGIVCPDMVSFGPAEAVTSFILRPRVGVDLDRKELTEALRLRS
jgi:hypothetical protein